MTFRAEGVSVSFGGVRATWQVGFSVERGEILGVVGPNGSGKTTLLNALTGLLKCEGRAWLDDQELSLRRPRKIRGQRILRLFQAPQTVEGLTALENVLLASSDRRYTDVLSAWVLRPLLRGAERSRAEKAKRAMELAGIGELADVEAENLTYGQRRLLDLARAISADPVVVMLDEPSAGLSEVESEHLAGVLSGLRTEGMILVIVDHKVDFLNGLCDRILAMHQGEKVAEGTPAEIWANDNVVEAYLGHAHA